MAGEQQDQLVREDNYSRGTINPQLMASAIHSNFLSERINLDDIKLNIYRSICGLEYDRKERRWVRVGYSIAKKEFIDQIFGMLHSYINSNNIHGNITQEQLNYFVFDFCEELIFKVASDGELQGVKPADMGLIVRQFEVPVFHCLSRAVNDGERYHEDNVFKQVETSTSRVLDGGVRI